MNNFLNLADIIIPPPKSAIDYSEMLQALGIVGAILVVVFLAGLAYYKHVSKSLV